MTITFNRKKIFAFADTHGRHRELEIPGNTDILVCAGDVCDAGNEMQLRDFFAWFAGQPAKYKLFVPGNHDLPFDIAPQHAAGYIPQGVTFIENGGVMLGGVHFYVLPVRPWLHGHGQIPYLILPDFGISTIPGLHGEIPNLIHGHGRQIPNLPKRVDVLVTHGAPKGILDENGRGCPILRQLVTGVKPGIHIFGHFHRTGGKYETVGKTTFYNVVVKYENIV